MKFFPATIAALSIATIAALATGTTGNDPLASVRSIDNAATPDKPAQLMLAGGRRNKCQENLGYGRTGSYGCG
ncbi:MAG TPA: hypothetical protein VFU24_12015 [Burkholderiales bacterium]|nr:hypothetical protein [Burkholderiales bacterium]